MWRGWGMVSSLYAQSVRRALVRVDDPAWTSPTRRCPTRRRRSRLARAAKDERWRARGSSARVGDARL